MRKIYLYLFAVLLQLQPIVSNAVVVVINTGTPGTPISSTGPILLTNLGSFKASRYAYLYTQTELATAGIPNGAIITDLGWMKNSATPTTGAAAFRIYMKNSSATSYSAASIPWATVNSGTTLVYQNLAQLIPATMNPNYIDFTLNTPFTYTGDALEICVEWDATAVSGNPGTGELLWMWSTVPDRIYGTSNTTLTALTTLSSTTSNTTITDRRPFIQITYSTPLPITLLNFAGEKHGSANRLTWETASELNAEGFELQRSADGELFSRIGFVPAGHKDENHGKQAYQFEDMEPLETVNYYRLKLLDKNGQYQFSKVIAVAADKVAGVNIQAIYPSPVKDELYIRSVAPTAQKATVVIMDISGKILMQQPIHLEAGSHTVQIPVSALAQGNYSVRLICQDGSQTTALSLVKH